MPTLTSTSVASPLVFVPTLMGGQAEFSPRVLATAPASILSLPESTLDEKISKSMAVLSWLMERYEVCFSYSGGKDSSTTLALGLAAAAQLKADGRTVQRFLILNSDTKVENPEVLGVVRLELTRIRRWLTKHGLPGHVEVTTPSILNEWAVHILGGQTLISTPLTNRNCTTDLKSVPLNRARVRFFGPNRVESGKFSVGVTGMRFEESAERAGNMRKRAESPSQVVQTSAQQDVFIAPIANWSTDDVMEFIGLAVNDLLPVEVYSDFKDVWRIYKDAEGECTVGRGDNKPSKGCGARHGCYVCSMVSSDKSMDAFLTQDQYAYMAPLARFRTYLNNTLFDLTKRCWIGRTIKDGHIQFAPGSYAPAYTQDLLRYALTLDAEERESAARLGIAPRFQLVSMQALIAIDAVWSLQAYALPFTGLAIYHDICVKGHRYPVPEVPAVPKPTMPRPRFIPVSDWDETATDDFTGLRDPVLEMVGGACSATKVITSKGVTREVMAIQTEDCFTVDEESVALLMDFELERLLERHEDAKKAVLTHGFGLVGQAYKFYVQYGVVMPAKSQLGSIDGILRRSAWRERHRLAGYNYNQDMALSMSVERIPVIAPPKMKPKVPKQITHEDTAQQRLSLRDLARTWSPDIAWRQLLTRAKLLKRLPAHCLHAGNAMYASQTRKGWALHHFVRKSELEAFLSDWPYLRRLVEHHQVGSAASPQLELFAA